MTARPSRARPGDERASDDGRVYDSFVVRVWRAEGSERIARAEVEHIQSAAVRVEVGPDPEWVLRALTAWLGDHHRAANDLRTGSERPSGARL